MTNSVSANIASEATTQKQNIDTVNAAADTDIVKQDTETKSESMIVAESTSNNEMKQKPLFDNSTQNFKLSRLAYLGMLSRKKP